MSTLSDKLKVPGDFWGGLASTLVALPAAVAFGVTIYSAISPQYAVFGALAGILGATALGLIASTFGGTDRLISAPCAPAAAVLSAFAIELVNQDGVKSRTSSVVKVTPGIRKDTIYMAHGYGTMNKAMTVASGKGIDDQSLITRLAVDPETGAHGMRNNFVKFIKNGKVLSIPA